MFGFGRSDWRDEPSGMDDDEKFRTLAAGIQDVNRTLKRIEMLLSIIGGAVVVCAARYLGLF